MAQHKADRWPKSGVEALDQEISARIRRWSAGKATAQDVSEASRLIRERADHMMPGIFRRERSSLGRKTTEQR